MAHLKIALVGNPNTGKTSLFNALTGLNQQVGNYPGITVEKKIGHCKLPDNQQAEIIDLPGTYSLNPSSEDEQVAVETLINRQGTYFPDVVVVVSEVSNLKQNLLLFTQVKDLQLPTILVINMADQMQRKGIRIDLSKLEQLLHTKVVLTSTRKGEGLLALKQAIVDFKELSVAPCVDMSRLEAIPFGTSESEQRRKQQKETIIRYQFINETLKETYAVDQHKAQTLRAHLDRFLIHPFFGYVVFAAILLLIFQAVFTWSSYPMDWIENGFAILGEWLATKLPAGALTNLLIDGVLPGIAGITVFIPQIAVLFTLIAILEESGYMSRVVFLMDNVMRRFGLSGKSVVPLISGAACAVPAVMIARNIESWKERLITILVTPFMTCSARLPVYLIIINLVIPEGDFLWVSYKAWTFFAMYFLGFAMALLSAFILDKVLKMQKNSSFFIAEIPDYKIPLLRNVCLTVYEKTKGFVMGAGKFILAISVLLWFLGSHGMGEKYNSIEATAEQLAQTHQWTEEQKANYIQSESLEYSFLGYIGKGIEPVFRPLGYDWKISIGVVASFAAREVFISTLSTVYSLGKDLDTEGEEGERTILAKMRSEVHPDGTPVYTLGTGISLLLYYAFAMQCLSTVAVVRKETNSWKWTALQFLFMTGIAYISAMLAFILIR
ncbi:ferrous iron transport protein B [Capnocytophaga sputigena]|uniref:ferrous iron transport protein B n=1 Tax=Capnocytophaga sputigena TaxID=1019 RepID=UPI002889A7CF|nr:ferrous iron transport protein B [Capnocytophaga sputigena]